MIYKFESFWANLGWWHHKFQDFERIVYLTSKFLLLLILIFLSPLVHELEVWALFWANFDIIALNQNFKILREWLHKQKIHHKVPFTFDFHLSISIGTWNTNLDLLTKFWVNDVTTGVKIAIFWEVISETNFPHFKVTSNYWFWSIMCAFYPIWR